MIDVLVIGGGNAALCAALMAREAGASVLLLEASPREWRGGNSQHTRNLRCMHDAPQDVLVDAYPEEEFWQDLLKVTGGLTDEKLARLVIRASSTCRDWMRRHGVHFQPPLSGALHVARTNAFFMGGGKALVNAYYRSAERWACASATTRRSTRSSLPTAASSPPAIGAERIEARACVLAAGGFESNREWLREAWGQVNGEWVADNFLIRGTRFNQGVLLKFMIDAGADADRRSVAVALRRDRRPRAAVRRRHLHAHRLRVAGRRGQPRRGALLRRGRGLLAQALRDLGPAGGAAAGTDRLFDHRRQGDRPLHAAGVPGHEGRHAAGAGARARSAREPRSCTRSNAYNAACRVGTFDHTALDDCRTEGLAPAKTHWARPLDTPPFYGYALRPGITFTYLGLKIDERAAVHFGGKPSPNLFVAGEMMAGNVLGKGYTAGVGMTIGTAFGRIAGTQAARGGAGRDGRSRMQPLDALTREAGALAAGTSMPGAALAPGEAEVARVMQICNACRYCEGFCAVFPAMTRRLEFGKADVHYLANLCHNCGACLHACQYAPPHEFRVNVPKAMATVRGRDLRRLRLAAGVRRALPAQRPDAGAGAGGRARALPAARRRDLTGALRPPAARRQFLRDLPAQPAGADVRRGLRGSRCSRWRSAWRGSGAAWRRGGVTGAAAGEAARDVLGLRYLDGGHGEGCNERRRRVHAVAPALPPPDVLRLPAVLRGHLRRDALPLCCSDGTRPTR